MNQRDAIIICRCEDLTVGDIRRAIESGAHSLDEIKRLTRCGMGPCQGRTCRPLVAAELSRLLGVALAQVPLPRFRPPTKPIKLKRVQELAQEAGDQDA